MKGVNMLVNKINTSQLLIILMVTALPLSVSSQVKLYRTVIGSTGNYSFSSISNASITSSVGEVVVPTFSSGDYILTQGFLQPNSMLLDEVSFIDAPTSSLCPDVQNGKIVVNNLDGCIPPYTVRLKKSEAGGFVEVKTVTGQQSTDEVVFENLGIDTFIVDVSGATFCTKSDTFFLDAKNPMDCEPKAYSGITPNGDGQNDTWIIDNIEKFSSNEVTIFNRWGSEVWNAKDYNNQDVAWEGVNKNGNNLPDATYFYIIKADGITLDGWVEVTR